MNPRQPSKRSTAFRWLVRVMFTLLFILGIPLGFLVTHRFDNEARFAEIASPSRRALMDYHREYLTTPQAHGIGIDPFTASDGTPCLVVVPSGNPGERGAIIRKQLKERGLVLFRFGDVSATLVLTHGDHPGKIAT